MSGLVGGGKNSIDESQFEPTKFGADPASCTTTLVERHRRRHHHRSLEFVEASFDPGTPDLRFVAAQSVGD